MIVPPFWSMPVRAPTWPLTTRSPPRSAAAGQRAGVAVDHDTPDIMFSHADQPTRPVMWTSGPSIIPQREVAEAALEGDLAARQDPDAERVARARVADGHLA